MRGLSKHNYDEKSLNMVCTGVYIRWKLLHGCEFYEVEESAYNMV